MSDHDALRHEAGRRLKRQADLTAYCARRFAEAARKGDLEAARRLLERELIDSCGTTCRFMLSRHGTITRRSRATTRPA